MQTHMRAAAQARRAEGVSALKKKVLTNEITRLDENKDGRLSPEEYAAGGLDGPTQLKIRTSDLERKVSSIHVPARLSSTF
jgi:hypothetical protein